MIIPVLSRDKWWRLLVLCGLYVSQGVPFGFVTITLAAALSTAGASTEDIGKVIAMATLPWALKWIAGPFVDRFTIASMGRRRPWILLGQGGMVLSLLAMASLSNPTENLKLLAWLVFIHNCFNAMQDVAVDALAVDLLPPEERGRVTGLMYGSKYLGTAIGGAGLSIVLGRQGLSSAFMAMIIVVSTLTLLPLLTIERPGQSILPRPGRGDPAPDDSTPGATQQPSFLEIFTRLANAFATRAAALTAVLMLLERSASGILSPIGTRLFTVELGWGEEKYGVITGGAAVVAGLAGAISGGFLADLFGPRRVAAVATVGFGGLLMGFGISEELWANTSFSTGYLLVESFLQGVFATSLFAICLGVSRPIVAATQFTAFMAMSNLSTTWSSSVSGWVETTLGVPGAFLAAGMLQASLVLILPFTLAGKRSEPLLKA